LQALPSVQDVPLATAVFTHPVVVLHESVVHTLESLQLGGVPGVQVPPRHTSAPLQALPSEQEKPSACGGLAHEPALQTSAVQGLPSLQLAAVVQDWQFGIVVLAQPVTALQLSIVQALLSLQLRAVPAVQVPLWQVSAPLQALPSLHAVPLLTAVFAHPVVVLHESLVQRLLSLQLSAVPAVQAPLWQVSAPLQTLPSEHDVPLVTAGF
jgi:hypothetical protein